MDVARNTASLLKYWLSHLLTKATMGTQSEVPNVCRRCKAVSLDPLLHPRRTRAVGQNPQYPKINFKHKDKYPLMPKLRLSAETCLFCHFLLGSILVDKGIFPGKWIAAFPWETEFEIHLRYRRAADSRNSDFTREQAGAIYLLQIWVFPAYKSPVRIILNLPLYASTGSLAARQLQIYRRPPEPQALSPTNVIRIHDWIRECRESHTSACHRSDAIRTPIRYPARLIDLGCSYRDSPRLVLTGTPNLLQTDVSYAALSYCWGPPTKMHLKLTMDILKNQVWQMTLPQAIPLTFQDAFTVTRQLGLRYIWIDALCIIQDNDVDWHAEAEKMGDIYRNAYVTIAALASTSTNDGFLARLKSNPAVDIPLVRKNTKWAATETCHVSYSSVKEDEDIFTEDLVSSNWNNRGWTFQERYLSRRTIFFGQNRVHMECRTSRRTEGYPKDVTKSIAWHRALHGNYSWDSIRSIWRRLVCDYSSRRFTVNRDRLQALQSMARELYQVLRARNISVGYFAGMWSLDLAEDLLWVCTGSLAGRDDNGVLLETSDEQPIAPSWAWVSKPGSISWLYLSGDATSVTVCQQSQIQHRWTEPFGLGNINRGEEGVLSIEGYMRHVDLHLNRFKGQTYQVPWTHLPRMKLRADEKKGGDWINFRWPYSNHSFTIDLDRNLSSDIMRMIASQGVYLALLFTTEGAERNGAYGMVLAKVKLNAQKAERGTFIRVGIFRTRLYGVVRSEESEIYVVPPKEELETVLLFKMEKFDVI